MYRKQIEIIKDFGYGLAKHFEQTGDIETLKQLENANRNTFGKILRVLIKDRIENGEKEPLFSFDNYVNLLFLENSLEWAEIKDLLLIRIYEIIHDG